MYADPECYINGLLHLRELFFCELVWKSVILDIISQNVIWSHNVMEGEEESGRFGPASQHCCLLVVHA
jgi:hypothetical protein